MSSDTSALVFEGVLLIAFILMCVLPPLLGWIQGHRKEHHS